MKVAMNRVEITPPMGFPLGGNVRKDRASRGVHDPVYCTLCILEDDDKTRCLLNFDLVGLHYDQARSIRKKVASVLDIHANEVMVFTTHTHSGPDTKYQIYPETKKTIDEYMKTLENQVIQAVKDCKDQKKVCSLRIHQMDVEGLSFQRRLMKKDGTVVMNFENFDPLDIDGPDGPIDPALTVLGFWDKDTLMGGLVNFTLHPAVLVGHQHLISRDYIHDLNAYIQKELGSEVLILFANGAEGNINHLQYDRIQTSRGFDETKRIGHALGEKVKECFVKGEPLKGDLRWVAKEVYFDYRPITKEELHWANQVWIRDVGMIPDALDGIPDLVYALCLLEMEKRKEKKVKTLIQGIKIGPFIGVTLPGEVFVEIGLKIKKKMKGRYPMVIGLANDYIGYIPTKEAFAKGGYETKTLWTSQLSVDAEKQLMDKIERGIIHVLEKETNR